jgi:uncharacterized protein
MFAFVKFVLYYISVVLAYIWLQIQAYRKVIFGYILVRRDFACAHYILDLKRGLIMFSLKPKEDKFFDMFIEAAKHVNQSALKLRELMDDIGNKEAKLREIEHLEHKGDKKSHDIFEQLNKSFITPIDREDIYMITKETDDIIDHIESTANRFIMFNIGTCTKEAKMMADMIVDSTRELIGLMEEVKVMGKSKKLTERIIEINRIEDEADAFFRQTVKDLFNGSTETLEVIKWREIYEYLEKTIDACEGVANIIEGVVMKHA